MDRIDGRRRLRKPDGEKAVRVSVSMPANLRDALEDEAADAKVAFSAIVVSGVKRELAERRVRRQMEAVA